VGRFLSQVRVFGLPALLLRDPALSSSAIQRVLWGLRLAGARLGQQHFAEQYPGTPHINPAIKVVKIDPDFSTVPALKMQEQLLPG